MVTTRKRIWVFLDAEVPEEAALLDAISARYSSRRQEYLRRLLIAGHAALSGDGGVSHLSERVSPPSEQPRRTERSNFGAGRAAAGGVDIAAGGRKHPPDAGGVVDIGGAPNIPAEVLGGAQQLKGLLG